VLETVQFHRQPRRRTIKIQNICSPHPSFGHLLPQWGRRLGGGGNHILSPEFEAGKSPSAQSAPQIPFRVRLVTAKLAGGGDRVHPDRMQIVAKNSRRETPHPDPLPAWAGRGNLTPAPEHQHAPIANHILLLPLLAQRGAAAMAGEELK